MFEYKFFPNSYNYSLIKDKEISFEHFLNLQIKFKNDFEKLLINIIDFVKIDNYINSFGNEIPNINDFEYNFYHKFSSLGSKYIFLRNNVHIENLSLEEIDVINAAIIDNVDLDSKFLLNTFSKVLYEAGESAMFGIPIQKNEVSSKSLVFEFAYDQRKFSDIKQYNFVNQISEDLFNYLSSSIKNVIPTDVSIIKYCAIPDIYFDKEKDEFK